MTEERDLRRMKCVATYVYESTYKNEQERFCTIEHYSVADALVIVPHLLITALLFALEYLIPRLGNNSTI